MKIAPQTEAIVDSALEGTLPTHDDLLYLCGLEENSMDAFYLLGAARTIARRASNGIGEVHAQIGIDANPCSKNCQFCSFAACNTARKGTMEMTREKILEHALEYEKQGANCLTIMITADYDFDKFLGHLYAIREAIDPAMPITANLGDFSAAQAKQIKDCGVGSVYHAVRMGEGVTTDIPIDTRFETIANAQDAGMKVQTCLEMIDPRHSDEEVVSVMERLVACKPDMANAWGMIAVPGTILFDDPHYSYAKYRVYNSAMRLLCPTDIKFGAGNLSWAEVGTNPRDDSDDTQNEGRGKSVEEVREDLKNEGWKTYEGPSTNW